MANKCDSFGEGVVLLRGWDLRPSDYKRAWKQGGLLTGQVETSNICDLLCDYCFREDLGTSCKKRLPGEMSIESMLDVINEMIGLGARTINVIGAGEPVLDPTLPCILKHISAKGAVPVVFTHGGNLDDRIIDILEETGASVVVKVNSFVPGIQDRMVNKTGYTKKREAGLGKLLERGFNKPAGDGSYRTKIGIDSVVCKDNINYILGIFRYCRDNNIMPIIKTFIPAGRTRDRTDMEISMREFLELSGKARDIDRKEYGISYDRLLPYLGGVPCTQSGRASIYVTVLGDIFECPGQECFYGNVARTPLKEAFREIRTRNINRGFCCPPRKSYWKRGGHIP